MRKALSIVLICVTTLILVVIGTTSLSSPQVIDEKINIATLVKTAAPQIQIGESAAINEIPFEDNQEIYEFDDPDSVIHIYVTVQKGNSSDNSDHTWAEVNSNTNWFWDNPEPIIIDKAAAIVQFGDENGPIQGEIGYSEIVPNATIQIRGATASLVPQKSYKIELYDRAGNWRGQSTIALNKHMDDLSRVRNKLSFDLMKDIPNLVSLRTQFVHLYVKDETAVPSGDTFIDYGLFTQIEQPNKAFLRNHLLDENGHLYKTRFFEFYRYENEIKSVDDVLYDPYAFETVLEIKGNKDHSKLIQMLEDVNNYSIPIEQTFEKYFNENNYLTWMAFNILVGNIDTQAQNYYLYSPQNSDVWYFIPWDYDEAFNRPSPDDELEQPYEDWEYGIANYWGNVLSNRLLRIDRYREKLTEKIEEINGYLSENQIQLMLNTYQPVVRPFVSRMPDMLYLPGTLEDFDLDYSRFHLEVDTNRSLYYQSLEDPMPFYLGTPSYEGNQMYFNWGDSYDFNAQAMTYEYVIARDWEFQDIVYTRTTKNITYVQIPYLDPGTYFWKVTASNEEGNSQSAFDYYLDAEGYQHSGMKYLLITEEGEILE